MEKFHNEYLEIPYNPPYCERYEGKENDFVTEAKSDDTIGFL